MCFVTHMSHVELVKSLFDFGLTNTEAFVFEAALNLGEATTRQISIAAGKERAQTYHALRRLQQLGLVDVTLSVPARFRPVELKYALDRLYLHQTVRLSKLDEMRKKIVKVQHSDVKVLFADSYSVVKDFVLCEPEAGGGAPFLV